MNSYTENIDNRYLHSEITGKILQGFYQVANKVGYGFELEILKNALSVEFTHIGLKYKADKPEKIEYKGEKIGEFRTDFFVEEKVVVLLISEEEILQKYEVKLHNILKNSQIEVGLLLNIFIESNHKRLFYSNNLKQKT
jgi:GxxExxY protein